MILGTSVSHDDMITVHQIQHDVGLPVTVHEGQFGDVQHLSLSGKHLRDLLDGPTDATVIVVMITTVFATQFVEQFTYGRVEFVSTGSCGGVVAA